MNLEVLTAVFIPIYYILISVLLQLAANMDAMSSTIVAQVTSILFLIPYFSTNRHKYSKLSIKHIEESIIIFLVLIGSYFTVVGLLSGHTLVFAGINSVTLFLGGAVLASIFEELYFRGLLTDLLKSLPPKVNTIFTAFLFSSAHIISGKDPIGYMIIFIIGIYTSVLRRRHNNLLPSMSFHFTWNFANLFLNIIN